MDFITIRVVCCNFLNLYVRYVLQYKSFLTIFSLETQQIEVKLVANPVQSILEVIYSYVRVWGKYFLVDISGKQQRILNKKITIFSPLAFFVNLNTIKSLSLNPSSIVQRLLCSNLMNLSRG